jgi:HD-GYP domain-containing protein (c-di-GMP phosphodiesterase class II)
MQGSLITGTKEQMLSAEEFLPIQSLDIEAETTITFNLYVNLPLNKKYVLYRRAGGQVESHRLDKFSEGNLSNFFIEKKDYNEFVKYVALRIRNLIGSNDNGENRKMMQAAAKSILSSTLDQSDPAIAAALMGNLNDITATIIESALENVGSFNTHTSKKLFHRLAQLADKGSDFQKHPINVASLAVLITFGIGYSREKILADMSMAALLHDVGLSKLPPKVISHAHAPLRLGIYERESIYKHPELSVEVLEEKNIPVSDLAKTIIRQHHEEFNGSGYPHGLRGYTINELSQILRVADEIDQLFTEFFSNPGNLKIRVVELLRRLGEQKVIEPLLLSRIRQVLI